MRLCTLKRRGEFHRVRGGTRWSGRAFLLEGKRRAMTAEPTPIASVTSTAATPDDPAPPAKLAKAPLPATARFGFTVTRKLGGAVQRNRIRRRLREALRLHAAEAAASDFDYVLVARPDAVSLPFAAIERDVQAALAHVARKSKAPPSGHAHAASGVGADKPSPAGDGSER